MDENDKENELAKQLSTYADGLMAFSFVQGATFCFLLVQNVTIACAIRSQWQVTAVCLSIGGAGYLSLLYLCHRGENELIGVPGRRGQKIKKIIPMLRMIRYCVVFVATAGELLIVLAAHFKPLFDCSHC